MMEPIIVKDWDSLPPEVVGEGILYSTRILCRQHHEMKARIAELEAQLKQKDIAASQHADAVYMVKIRELEAQLKTAKRDAILEAHMAGQSSAGTDPSFSLAQEYANTIGKE